MKIYFLLGVLLLSFSVSVEAQTARQYFNELRSKDTIANDKGKYVCFPDGEGGGFSVLAKAQAINKTTKADRYRKKRRSLPENYLVEQVYSDGKPSEQNIYMRIDKDDDVVWLMKQTSLYHGKSVYMINWATGRYRLVIYAVGQNSRIPSYVENGSCELIQQMSEM